MAVACGDGDDVILQAFHWNVVKTQGDGVQDGRSESWYRLLERRAEDIARLGVSLVYLPPSWRDDSSWIADGRHGGGEGYFWHDFDLDSRYGSQAELAALVRSLANRGVRVIADLVPNHRDRDRMQRDRWPWPGPHWASGGRDGGAGFMGGGYDLDLAHPEVQSRIREAMIALMDLGVCGWRWDFVWGYDVEDVVRWLRETPAEEYFCMGEYWQGDGTRADDPLVRRFGPDERARILGWARAAGSTAFDIPLKRAINTGEAARLGEGLHADPDPAVRRLMVTYVDNHDTGSSPYSAANGWGQRHWPCPDPFKHRAYAFILGMPGIPCLYWPDVFDWGLGDDLARLVAARRRAGVVAGSSWRDLRGEYGGFAAVVQDARGEDALALSIDSTYRGPGAGWSVAHERWGEYTVWVREGRP